MNRIACHFASSFSLAIMFVLAFAAWRGAWGRAGFANRVIDEAIAATQIIPDAGWRAAVVAALVTAGVATALVWHHRAG